MKTIIKMLSALMILALLSSCGQSAKDDSAEIADEMNDDNFEERDDRKDADFVVEIISSNYAEVELAQLALNKSQNAEIRDIAQKLETDHSRIINELKAFADKSGIVVPNEETSKAQNKVQNLAEKDVEDFDKKWCSELKDKHEKTISSLENHMEKTENQELKTWIAGTLPDIRMHLKMISEYEDRMKSKG